MYRLELYKHVILYTAHFYQKIKQKGGFHYNSWQKQHIILIALHMEFK